VNVAGVINPPGDKSVTHRALILAGLSRARVSIRRPLTANDARSTAKVLRQCGSRVSPIGRGRRVAVQGRPWKSPSEALDCGSTGTTARLIMGAIAGQNVSACVTGDASLRRRPMRRVTKPLVAMGARFEEESGDGLPLCISGGNLRPLDYQTPVTSGQIKTAILLAGVSGGVPVKMSEPVRSRDHSERLLEFLGFDIDTQGTTVELRGPPDRWPSLRDFELEIPGDISSAAFLVGAAVLAESGELVIADVGVNPTRTGFLNVLERMGGCVERSRERVAGNEPVADLVVRPSTLRGVEVAAEEIPSVIDEIPLLAVLAGRAEGETCFRSVGELRVKESDRRGLIAADLRAVGVNAEVQGEDLFVEGKEEPPRGRVETARDHRLAMAFAVLGTVPGAEVEVSELGSAAVSYPNFQADLARAGNPCRVAS
jgi:3-phosphoshikimate 1-carboxyvinyltransferase